MAQTGYTPILIYGSGTATNVPLAANMTTSAAGVELALNYKDGKLFYKDDAGVIQVLAQKACVLRCHKKAHSRKWAKKLGDKGINLVFKVV